jgi:hypothetical protein
MQIITSLKSCTENINTNYGANVAHIATGFCILRFTNCWPLICMHFEGPYFSHLDIGFHVFRCPYAHAQMVLKLQVATAFMQPCLFKLS